MSKYTRQQVINERKCGLVQFDKAVAKVGIQHILDETVRISKVHPDTWGRGWSNVTWALGNAWREALDPTKDIASTANLDEELTLEQMQWLAVQLGLNVVDYKPTWDRRPPGKEIQHKAKPTPAPGQTVLTTGDLKILLNKLVEANLNNPSSALRQAILGTPLEKNGKCWNWTRESKKKDSDKNVVRVFDCGIYAATVTSDPTDTQVLRVILQVGPGWSPSERPTPVELDPSVNVHT